MAFRRGARDMKKQSYYVWFLGAKESRGLRGPEYIGPVLRFLLEREREIEPPKVTLQVSGKGIKMVQNIARGVRGKMEQVKHLIPQHAVTCAHQDGDLVCCILLLYNPATRCPVHVHVYRCDSAETATMLRLQLQQLADKPENQAKFREIENRLAVKGLLREPPPRMPSDGRTEDGSEDRSDSEDSAGPRRPPAPVTPGAAPCSSDRMASLYASLAAELREKLSNPERGPLLLPPKDYGTMCKRQGAPRLLKEGGSKSSSGIGSDELLPRELDSSSDEEWSHRRSRPVSFPASHGHRQTPHQQGHSAQLRHAQPAQRLPQPSALEPRVVQEPLRHVQRRPRDYRHSFVEPARRALPF
ncbi:hypothetical protein HPB47_005256 [Ixodes persulcatus]|uniref:Uncharacterized protein n=1 Tax=Ixodes persulcatus TaxID=34615 RepID=A0AC60PDH2_IXOPE|nr:hypothetical protein HPB47_005256 [Ixodes persulcatus]